MYREKNTGFSAGNLRSLFTKFIMGTLCNLTEPQFFTCKYIKVLDGKTMTTAATTLYIDLNFFSMRFYRRHFKWGKNKGRIFNSAISESAFLTQCLLFLKYPLNDNPDFNRGNLVNMVWYTKKSHDFYVLKVKWMLGNVCCDPHCIPYIFSKSTNCL